MILEREAATAAVAQVLQRARAGFGQAHFIVAEAGLGKTTMLANARQQAGSAFRVGLGRGDPMESSLPFVLVGQAIEALGGRKTLESTLIGASAAEARTAQFYGLLRWVEDLAARTPVVLLLDDLHWADADSLGLLCFLCRPVAVIGALRPWPPGAHRAAIALARRGYASLQSLARLSDHAAEELLLSRVNGPVSVAGRLRAVQLCAGNPLLVEALVDAGVRGEDFLELGEAGLPAGSQELLLRRFVDLPPEAVALSRAASVLGGHFGVELAAEVARLGEEELEVALEALCRSGLVRQSSGAHLEFVHPLFRRFLYDDLAPPLRARLHARAFGTLVRRGWHAQAAGHALEGHLAGNPEAVVILEKTGREALATGGVTAGVRYLQAAVDYAGDTASPGLLLALGEAFLAGGQPAEASTVFERGLSHPEATTSVRVTTLRNLGRALAFRGNCRQAAARFGEAVALARDADPTAAVEVLLDAGAARAMTTLATAHAYALARMGRLAEAEQVAQVATSLIELAPTMECFASVCAASILLQVGKAEEAQGWAARAQHAAASRGESHAMLYLLDLSGQRHLRDGRLPEACDCYEQLEAHTARMGIREPCAPAWARHAVAAYLGADRPEDARRVLAWLTACAEPLPCRWPRIAMATALASFAEREGDREGAEAQFLIALSLHDQVELPIQEVETLLEYGAFLRRSGQVVQARAVLAEAVRLAEATGAAWLAGFARAELAIAGGRRRRGYEHPCRLTPQEQRVAALTASGASNKEVACQLSLSVGTVESHLHRIYAKLGIGSRRELMLRGIRASQLSSIA